jgi:hypothetical protein
MLTRSTHRPEVSQDDNSLFALFDAPRLNGLDKGIFSIEDTGFTDKSEPLFPCNLRDGTTGSKVSLQYPVIKSWSVDCLATRNEKSVEDKAANRTK